VRLAIERRRDKIAGLSLNHTARRLGKQPQEIRRAVLKHRKIGRHKVAAYSAL
jgi:hypothetical protein